MTTRIFRCRIVREVSPGVVQSMIFIGPSIDHIPQGWSLQMRVIHYPRNVA